MLTITVVATTIPVTAAATITVAATMTLTVAAMTAAMTTKALASRAYCERGESLEICTYGRSTVISV